MLLRVREPDPMTGTWWRDDSRRVTPPPVDDDTRRQRVEERARLREEDERRNAAIRAALGRLPRFHLPNRTYYLLTGSVSAVPGMRYPDSSTESRNPDLFWPDDRRWFVATDVDFWSLYIGGDADFIADLSDSVPTSTKPSRPTANWRSRTDRLPGR